MPLFLLRDPNTRGSVFWKLHAHVHAWRNKSRLRWREDYQGLPLVECTRCLRKWFYEVPRGTEPTPTLMDWCKP